jgi:hypothetical protein
MSPGAVGGTMMFVVSLVGTTIVALSALAYTAHCILVVVTDTSAGVDRVRISSDLMIDWIVPAVRLFGTVAVLMVPVGFLFRALGASLYPDEPVLRFFAITLPWLWLAFPVALLSSMSVGVVYAVVTPTVVWDLVRVFPATLSFYALSALGAWTAGSLWILALHSDSMLLTPLAAVVWATFVLLYSRLLGRVAWLTSRLKHTVKKKVPAAKAKPRPQKAKTTSAVDPWAVPEQPEEVKPKPAPKATAKKKGPKPVEGYAMSDEPPCRPPEFKLVKGSPFLDVKDVPSGPPPAAEPPLSPRPRYFDDEDDGVDYQVAADDTPLTADTRPKMDVEPSRVEMRLAREEEEPLPVFPMFSGVYTFPWYMTSLRAFLVLSLIWTVLGLCVERLVETSPVGGGPPSRTGANNQASAP